VFSDIYPEGHQTGVTVIQHDRRVAANGDLRLEASPGQWSPVPASGERTVDAQAQIISQTLFFPDPAKNRTGFNPIVYPDLELTYTVRAQPLEDNSFRVWVDLEKPLPKEWIGKVGFNFELFPGHLFGKGWAMEAENGDDAAGIFPVQPNGPVQDRDGEWVVESLARGNTLVVAPEEPLQRMTIESRGGTLELLDGRGNHNNSWYIVRSTVPAGATERAIEWVITPHTAADWQREPVLQVSQLGYAPGQPKRVIVEQDRRDESGGEMTLVRLGPEGKQAVANGPVEPWGEFLRYRYFTWDFSAVKEPGLYQLEYRGQASQPFRIAADVYARHAWQPTLEYYLPVQMCHLRVSEKFRVWHGLCHDDDARMAPVDHNHFDGYISGPETLTPHAPLQPVPGLNRGGWHDAGDYDLRVESQMTTVWLLAMMVEEFGLNYDATTIDQQQRLVEIHQPDGKNDALQQIEHGLLSVLGAYESLGRLYRGIITPTLRQYVHLGDAATQTDNAVRDEAGAAADDRWVFTEINPTRELNAAAGLAAAARVLRGYDDELASRALAAAQALFRHAEDVSAETSTDPSALAFALTELFLTTQERAWLDRLVALQDELIATIDQTGWIIGRVVAQVGDPSFTEAIDTAVAGYQAKVREDTARTPYGVPYEPRIWGAGWDIQRFGVEQYFFHRAWPQATDFDSVLNALNFVLGAHPGENTMSFVSGVGAESALVAYGVNRADWSFIPGGVISGTNLVRPDLPELKIWPFFWQQTEYVMGGGATNYMFLVLAADAALSGDAADDLSEVAFDWFRYEGRDPQFGEPLQPGHYRNPVLAGFYPDPSVVRVDENYYLVTSSFAYFPGLPVFHSTDLVNWRQIGHALNRREQLTFENGQGISRGIFAPTIRHHDGNFYIITTDVDGIGNFYITAEDPAGPWSDPVRLPEIDGIDPDLFFDDDGRAWIAHNGPPVGEPRYDGHRAIWLWEFDLKNRQVVKDSGRVIVDGGVDISQQPVWIEAPHLFQVDGRYYLSCAEGGTGDGHSQVIFRTRSLEEPFVPWEHNPILTQRDLDPNRPNPITSTGHADFVQTPASAWWAVFLGVRPYEGGFHNTGRETFLLPVHWQDGWPRILEAQTPVPWQPPRPELPPPAELPPPQTGNFVWRDDFDQPDMDLEWVRVRTSPTKWFELDSALGELRLAALPIPLSEQVQPAFLARRQQHRAFEASTRMELPRSDDVSAGLAAFQSSTFHYFLGVRRDAGGYELFLEQVRDGKTTELARTALADDLSHIVLGLEQHGAELDFYYLLGDQRQWLMRNVDASLLSTQVAGGFVGATLGIHARRTLP
jgi:beta-xylosidase